MRLPRRVQVVLAAFLALVVIALGLDVSVLRTRERTVGRLHDTLEPAQLEVAGVVSSLVDAEAAERGFLVTGDHGFLARYERTRERTSAALEHVQVRLQGHDDLVASVDRLRSKIEAWQSLGATFEIAAKRSGRDQVVATLVAGGTGQRLFDAARSETTNLESGLAATADAARRHANRLDGALIVIDLGTLMLTLAFLAVASFLARAWFTKPLAGLGASVQEVAAGALRSTVTVVGPPEFSELAADVDAMRRRILSEVEAGDRAREALADRGMVVLTLRDELAASTPELPPGVGLAGRFAAAQGIVAGDWFDVVRLSDNRLGVALVDVSGHGAGVGAFALRTKALTVAAMQTLDPGAAFGWVAQRLGDTDEQFLTGAIFVLDVSSGVVRYASAGHPPLLLAGVRGITELRPTGPLIGPVEGTWSTEEVTLDAGGVLVAFSDGLIEARDADGASFGVRRLRQIVEANQLGGSDAVADACITAVQRHQVKREDDLTLVVLSR